MRDRERTRFSVRNKHKRFGCFFTLGIGNIYSAVIRSQTGLIHARRFVNHYGFKVTTCRKRACGNAFAHTDGEFYGIGYLDILKLIRARKRVYAYYGQSPHYVLNRRFRNVRKTFSFGNVITRSRAV